MKKLLQNLCEAILLKLEPLTPTVIKISPDKIEVSLEGYAKVYRPEMRDDKRMVTDFSMTLSAFVLDEHVKSGRSMWCQELLLTVNGEKKISERTKTFLNL